MKKYFNLLMFSALSLASMSAMAQDVLNLFVGSYSDASTEGIKWFTFDQETGQYDYLTGLTGVENPSYLALSTDNKYLYSVAENADNAARLYALSIDSAAKTISIINSVPTHGDAPCHVMIAGDLALTANYSGGSIGEFRIKSDGSLANDTLLQYNGGYQGSERQGQSHLHFCYASPDGKHVYANDLGADKIYRFDKTTVDSNTYITSSETPYLNTERGFGPRHAVFHPNGKFLYVLGELSGTIEVFAFNALTGDLDLFQTVAVDPLFASGSADIHVSHDGRFLYASNRLKGDGIAILGIDSNMGLLRNISYQYTGVHPRNFIITPNDKYLLCACRDDNCIQIFKRDVNTGLLTDTGNKIVMNKPVCVIFQY